MTKRILAISLGWNRTISRRVGNACSRPQQGRAFNKNHRTSAGLSASLTGECRIPPFRQIVAHMGIGLFMGTYRHRASVCYPWADDVQSVASLRLSWLILGLTEVNTQMQYFLSPVFWHFMKYLYYHQAAFSSYFIYSSDPHLIYLLNCFGCRQLCSRYTFHWRHEYHHQNMGFYLGNSRSYILRNRLKLHY